MTDSAASTAASSPARALVLAKAPVPGRVKTRLGVDVGHDRAAEVAAASLLDTLRACAAAFGPERCCLALAGDLTDAVRYQDLRATLAGWTVVGQRGEDLGERIAAAHADLTSALPVPTTEHGDHEGITVQIGMDTPQVTPQGLRDAAAAVRGGEHDAALGPAEDGGWWVLALRDPARATALAGVPMSTDTTYADTRAALEGAGCTVAALDVLRDVDTVADADVVAAEVPADSEFAGAWAAVATRVGGGR